MLLDTSKFAIAFQPQLSALTQPVQPVQLVQNSQNSQNSALLSGLRLYEAGRYAEAIALWQRSLAQMDQLQQVLCFSYLALAYQKLGNWPQAEQLIAASFERLEQANYAKSPTYPRILAQLFNSQGQLQLGMGKPEAALTSWQQAETYYAAAEDELGQLGSQINQAQALQTMGLYRRAQSLLEVIISSLAAQPDSQLKALGLRSLGNVFQVIGKLVESQQVLQQSLAIAERLDLQQQISETQFSLANSLRGLVIAPAEIQEGTPQGILVGTSKELTATVLQLYQQSAATALTPIGRLQAQLNQLSLLIDGQQTAQAEALAAQLQPAIRQLTPSRDSIYLQVNFATQLSKLAATQTFHRLNAAELLNQAIQQAQSLFDQRAESYAVGQLAYLYEQTQQWDIAQSLSQQALLLAQSANADDISYRWQWQLGRILKQRDPNDLSAAKATYREALKTLDLIRRDLLSTQPEFQVSFRGDVEPLYRELVDLLVRPNATSEDLQLAREVIEALRLAELENFFRSACLDPAQQIDQVDSSAAVFYPILLPNRLLVIVSLPNQALRYYSTSVLQTEVEATIAAFRRSLILPYTANDDIQKTAYQLYTWLIEPVAAALSERQIETLVFVQDGVLQSIPMAALYDGERYLLETYSIALAPGLRLLEPIPLEQVPLQAITAGLTEARHSFEPLEFVEIELAQIRSEIPTELLLDQGFTGATLAEKLSNAPAPILHIATHGQFSSQAEQTFILAWDQPITAGQFSALLQSRSESEQLELLVLSACETAVGDKRAALGLAGLAVESGARSTLASLWLIDDESTPLLMTQFYKNLKSKLNKATALRQAQLSLLQGQYQHPRFWAAFVLLGNWQ